MCNDEALTIKYFKEAMNFLFAKYINEPEKSKRKSYMHSLVQAIKSFKGS